VGGTAAGHADGAGTAATFNQPLGAAVDGAGNVYVADTTNNLIRKIDAGGTTTTLAGGGAAGGTALGSADGQGVAATFKSPSGVAVDGAGTVYVSDTGNNLIRKITSGGAVSTLAGGGSAGGTASGNANGVGTAATFSGPMGLAVDGSLNVYVVDQYNSRIRKIDPSGAVTTFTTAVSFPWGVAVGGSYVYVGDTNNQRVCRFALAGGACTAIGGTASPAFNYPQGVAVDGSGNVFVADNFNNLIRKIDASGAVTTVAGGAGGTAAGSADGAGTAATFRSPTGVALDSAGSVLYVVDNGNNLIRKMSY